MTFATGGTSFLTIIITEAAMTKEMTRFILETNAHMAKLDATIETLKARIVTLERQYSLNEPMKVSTRPASIFDRVDELKKRYQFST